MSIQRFASEQKEDHSHRIMKPPADGPDRLACHLGFVAKDGDKRRGYAQDGAPDGDESANPLDAARPNEHEHRGGAEDDAD